MSRAVQVGAIGIAFALGLVLAPLALAFAALWFAWRAVVYASATPGQADIVGWTGQGSAAEIETAQAFPQLRYTARDGITRSFISRMAFNIYDDPPPTGSLPIRYHLSPRVFAEVDDKAHWFTGPALALAAALLGTFIAAVWRPIAALWFGS